MVEIPVLGGSFGLYPAVTEVISANAQAMVIARINLFKALFVKPSSDVAGSGSASQPHTDFDQIPPHTAAKIRDEIDALIAVIDAAPTA